MYTYPYYNIIVSQNWEEVKMKSELFTIYSQNPLSVAALSAISEGNAAELLLAANADTAPHGLVLTEAEARAVVEAQQVSLMSAGRLDFSGTLPAKIARAFCDSPYIHQADWAETISALIDLFYDIKNTYDASDTAGRTAYALADDALLARMRRWFDDPACGSLARLGDLLQAMAERLRWGFSADEPDRRGVALYGLDTRAWLEERDLREDFFDQSAEFSVSDLLGAD